MRQSDHNIIAFLIHPTLVHLPHHHTSDFSASPPPVATTHKYVDLKTIKLSKREQVQIWAMFMHVYVLSVPNHKEW